MPVLTNQSHLYNPNVLKEIVTLFLLNLEVALNSQQPKDSFLSAGQNIVLATCWAHSAGGHCNPKANFIHLDTPEEQCKGVSARV